MKNHDFTFNLVYNGEDLDSGILHVTLRTRQWLEASELKAEHSIIDVHHHHNRLDHPSLPGTDDE